MHDGARNLLMLNAIDSQNDRLLNLHLYLQGISLFLAVIFFYPIQGLAHIKASIIHHKINFLYSTMFHSLARNQIETRYDPLLYYHYTDFLILNYNKQRGIKKNKINIVNIKTIILAKICIHIIFVMVNDQNIVKYYCYYADDCLNH